MILLSLYKEKTTHKHTKRSCMWAWASHCNPNRLRYEQTETISANLFATLALLLIYIYAETIRNSKRDIQSLPYTLTSMKFKKIQISHSIECVSQHRKQIRKRHCSVCIYYYVFQAHATHTQSRNQAKRNTQTT